MAHDKNIRKEKKKPKKSKNNKNLITIIDKKENPWLRKYFKMD